MRDGYHYHREGLRCLAATFVRRPEMHGGSVHVSSPRHCKHFESEPFTPMRRSTEAKSSQAPTNTLVPSWTILPTSKTVQPASGEVLRPLLLAGKTVSLSKATADSPGNLVSHVVGTYIKTGLMPDQKQCLASRRFTTTELKAASKTLSYTRPAW